MSKLRTSATILHTLRNHSPPLVTQDLIRATSPRSQDPSTSCLMQWRSRDPALPPLSPKGALLYERWHVAQCAHLQKGCSSRHFSHCPIWGWWRSLGRSYSREASALGASARGECLRFQRPESKLLPPWAPSFLTTISSEPRMVRGNRGVFRDMGPEEHEQGFHISHTWDSAEYCS